MLWKDLQETFFIVFAPCLVGVILPFFVGGGILIAVYRFVSRMAPKGRSYKSINYADD
jgi:hypothetical protein